MLERIPCMLRLSKHDAPFFSSLLLPKTNDAAL